VEEEEEDENEEVNDPLVLRESATVKRRSCAARLLLG
jgi:hypothetical protein